MDVLYALFILFVLWVIRVIGPLTLAIAVLLAVRWLMREFARDLRGRR